MTRRATMLLAVCAAALAAAAWCNSFQGAFVGDDAAITGNAAIRKLWPPGPILTGPRPILDLTFAVNYAISKLDPRGFHAGNLLIHLAAALTLFGVLRRTLWTAWTKVDTHGHLSTSSATSTPSILAVVIVLLWAVHPLQTDSVTYVIRRAESLAGLFYLLTLYCAIRGFASPAHRLRWHLGAVLACALGAGVQPVIASAPIIVLLYDRLFVARSFAAALRKSRALYLGLAAAWILLAVLASLNPPGKELGFGARDISSEQYAVTELGVVARYLRLCFWPAPLCAEFRWPLAGSLQEVLLPALLIGALLAATLFALRRRSPLAFPGAWFFLVLAPSSSFIPTADACFEHRMYLPLAAVLATVVLAAHALGSHLLKRLALPDETRARIGWIAGVSLLLAAAAALSLLTFLRNRDYRSPVKFWAGVVRTRPRNLTAHLNLATALAADGQLDDAEAEIVVAQALAPNDARPYDAMGRLQFAGYKNYPEAIASYRRALELDKDLYQAHHDLAIMFTAQGKDLHAISEWHDVLRLGPAAAGPNLEIARLLVRRGRFELAADRCRQALDLAPDSSEILVEFAWLRASAPDPAVRDGDDALRMAQRALDLADPDDVRALDALAAACAETGQFDRAASLAQQAVRAAQLLGRQDLATAVSARMLLYRSGRPFRQPDLAEPPRP